MNTSKSPFGLRYMKEITPPEIVGRFSNELEIWVADGGGPLATRDTVGDDQKTIYGSSSSIGASTTTTTTTTYTSHYTPC